MSSDPQVPKHWPFDQESEAGIAREARRASMARERARSRQEEIKARVRHDRLLVGGRAHVRKPGLS